MPHRIPHDGQPPQNWPAQTTYLTKQRLSPSFPPSLVPFLFDASVPDPAHAKFQPRPSPHPAHIGIKAISAPGHPANGQNGLFAKKKVGPGELLLPYIGIIHVSFTPADDTLQSDTRTRDEHAESDYDLSLNRISASDPRNPFPGMHVSIAVDAAKCGNAARFANDYRGIGPAPNAEFRRGKGEAGELRMELWSLKSGIAKGDEVLVSYGKGWWGARRE